MMEQHRIWFCESLVLFIGLSLFNLVLVFGPDMTQVTRSIGRERPLNWLDLIRLREEPFRLLLYNGYV
jgi:hypothetical protein